MISVVVYGRNDSHGYNLHKRAAISLNAIAQLLDDEDDEILFVDCNTPDDMPTFPVAIRDTLTQRTLELLRVLRVRPSVYDRHRGNSPLVVLEPHSRNVAVRRSNPRNRWILSTNTDMVFVPRSHDRSLSAVARELPDGFYELPRFEVPEALWESLDRRDPDQVIQRFGHWGKRLHLNHIVHLLPDVLYDGPGDFQLMLREQLFEIGGFDESMVLGWHVDSNIARRLSLLNGKTSTLIDHFYGYHCDHTRSGGVFHASGRVMNDFETYYHGVTEPVVESQRETWGMAREALEEERLCSGDAFAEDLESVVPGLDIEATEIGYGPDYRDLGLLYDNDQVFPYLASHLSTFPGENTIGYFGANEALVHQLAEFLGRRGSSAHIFVARELLPRGALEEAKPDPRIEVMAADTVGVGADALFFDASMRHFWKSSEDEGFPVSRTEPRHWMRLLIGALVRVSRREREAVKAGIRKPREFVLLAANNTWFQRPSERLVQTTLIPFGCGLRQGIVRDRPDFVGAQKRLVRIYFFRLLLEAWESVGSAIRIRRLRRSGRAGTAHNRLGG